MDHRSLPSLFASASSVPRDADDATGHRFAAYAEDFGAFDAPAIAARFAIAVGIRQARRGNVFADEGDLTEAIEPLPAACGREAVAGSSQRPVAAAANGTDAFTVIDGRRQRADGEAASPFAAAKHLVRSNRFDADRQTRPGWRLALAVND
ncbi:hypothetical protein [Aureimonas sp. AU12]|uniref:hypothetical protein n=1 Tax=Aureimonas sp. AU12 TaxID=1638161 RepID=UPI0007820171|nr:hypothetical protein [Aureimonas sp. AU12]